MNLLYWLFAPRRDAKKEAQGKITIAAMTAGVEALAREFNKLTQKQEVLESRINVLDAMIFGQPSSRLN